MFSYYTAIHLSKYPMYVWVGDIKNINLVGGGGLACDEKMLYQIKDFVKMGSKRSKNNEKGCQKYQKSKRNLVQNDSKLSNDRLLWNVGQL